MIPPKFLYFDLGMVLVNFSIEQMFRQMAEVSGVTPDKVKEVLITDGLQKQIESGKLSNSEFYEAYCVQIQEHPDYDALCHAGSAIFSLNLPMLPLVAQLRQAGYRMGILSNTCDCHWQYCYDRYRIISEGFQIYALSYRIGAIKPEAAIYKTAAELANCRLDEMFFVDDIPGHVESAKAAGVDAILFTSAADTAAALRDRGLKFNY